MGPVSFPFLRERSEGEKTGSSSHFLCFLVGKTGKGDLRGSAGTKGAV